jgi:hypothetical protein
MRLLWDTWQQQPLDTSAAGTRIYARWVEIDPNDPGWFEWRLLARVRKGRVRFVRGVETSAYTEVIRAVRASNTAGVLEIGRALLQWARTDHDRPPGPTLEEWALARGPEAN